MTKLNQRDQLITAAADVVAPVFLTFLQDDDIMLGDHDVMETLHAAARFCVREQGLYNKDAELEIAAALLTRLPASCKDL